MYEERTNRFSVKDLILLLLFIAFFVFLLMWIFPTKANVSNIKNSSNQKEKEDLAHYERVFNKNIVDMKDGAKKYFVASLLPQGQENKVTMTLEEMFEKNIISLFKDKDGNKCDEKNSYVEITKIDNDYTMKVNLKCSKEENYLLVYMGKYEQCTTAICEKNEKDVTDPMIRKGTTSKKASKNVSGFINQMNSDIVSLVCPGCTSKPDINKPSADPVSPTPTSNPAPKNYECEYVKVTNATYSAWGDWSGWTEQIQYESQSKQVQTKIQKLEVTQKILTGYKVTTYKDVSKPIYKQEKVQNGVTTKRVCSAFGPGSVCIAYTTVETPNYVIVNVLTGYGTSERREPIYRMETKIVEKRLYSFRTRGISGGYKDIKWDICEGSLLMDRGYHLTENKREK